MEISDTNASRRPRTADTGSGVPASGAALHAQGPQAGAGSSAAAARSASSAAFQQQLARARSPSSVEAPAGSKTVMVQRGDTLTGLVRSHWEAQGGSRQGLSAVQAHRWALQVARDNGLADPNRIQVGQQLRVDAAPPPVASAAAPRLPSAVSASAPSVVVAAPAVTQRPIVSASPAVAAVVAPTGMSRLSDPVLSQTLDRAVDLGFIPAAERLQVQTRIAELADKHGFRPDDFAKAALMESDGFNPRASNGNCHGIIQFCSGPDRGAASAGYAQRPKDILGLSVLRQLDLVDRYFDDTKLREFKGRDGRVRLDDLYLTILTPAARQERRPASPLPINGPQALDLHVRRDRQAPITRNSILAGLHANARQRLGQFVVAELSTP